jgi:hypothetical protein
MVLLFVDDIFPDDDLDFMQSLCSEEDGAESFEQLFSKFRLMKGKAQFLFISIIILTLLLWL